MTWETAKSKILMNLKRTIPPPAPKVAKPQKSFATLKPGDKVQSNETQGVFIIDSVDSLGAYAKVEGQEDPARAVLTKNWKETYTKVPKRRKKNAQ